MMATLVQIRNRSFMVSQERALRSAGTSSHKVNILAFQSVPSEEESLVRFVVDNPTKAKSVLDTQKLKYKEAEVAQVRLPHRPGELARAALQLGEAQININYAYCGIEADTNAPLLIFAVADVGRAVKILDKAAAAAAGA